MSEAATHRKPCMDVMKALGVIAIVLAHSDPPAFIGNFVSTYYIAIFFFVSGYFYKDEYSDDLGLLARRRIRSLYVPFVAWNLFYLALHNLFFRLGLYSSQTGYGAEVSRLYTLRDAAGVAFGVFTLRATEQMAGALWFLISLITVTAIFGGSSWLCRRLTRRYAEWLRFAMVLLLFAAGYLNQPWVTWPAFVNTSLVGVLVFYGGFIFKRIEDRIPVTAVLAGLAFALVVIGRGTVNMGANRYAGPLTFAAVAGAGIYTNLYAATLLQANKLLNYLGRNTIFVVATHFLAFKAVSLVYVAVYGQPAYMLAKFPVISGGSGWWIAYFACGVLLPLGAKYLYDSVRRKPPTEDTALGTASPQTSNCPSS